MKATGLRAGQEMQFLTVQEMSRPTLKPIEADIQLTLMFFPQKQSGMDMTLITHCISRQNELHLNSHIHLQGVT